MNRKLEELIPILDKNRNNNDYWVELDAVLRDLLNPSTNREEEAFNDLLVSLWDSSVSFTKKDNGLDLYDQMCLLIRISFQRKNYRILRKEIQEEINILKLKKEVVGLSVVEQNKLRVLKEYRKKL